MTLRFHCNIEEGLNTIVGDGPADWAALQGVLTDLVQDAEYDASLPHLIDLRQVQLNFETQRVEQFSNFFGQTFGPGVNSSVALVVRDNLQAQECAQFYQITCTLARSELFDDYKQALRWLIRREFVSPVNS